MSSRSTTLHTAQPKSPPGPRRLNPLSSTLAFQRDPLAFLSSLAQQYGDIAQFRLLLWPTFVINHPDHIKHILQENYRNYDKDVLLFKVVRPLMGNGLIINPGQTWLQQRRLIQPAFHKKRIAAFGTLMTDATIAMLQRWESSAKKPQTLDLAEEITQLTLQIVSKSLFGIDISDKADSFGQAFSRVNAALIDDFHMPFPPRNLPIPRNRRFWADIHTLDEVVYTIIHQRRQRNEDTGDLLSMLLQAVDEETGQGMNNQQLRDEVITLLLAGHETTANALAWTWYLLSQHADVEQKLHTELDAVLAGRTPTIDDLPALPYTRMLIDEAMRLYPPAWILMRRAINADEIGGYHVPAHSYILWSSYVTHRHPAFWENPDQFDPERFSPERSANRPRHAYIPFGGGPRMCVGQAFALMEAHLIVATVAQRYRFALVPGHKVEPEPLLTLRPRYGLLMNVQPR